MAGVVEGGVSAAGSVGVLADVADHLAVIEDDARLFAAANVVASIVAGLGAAFRGVALSQAIWS